MPSPIRTLSTAAILLLAAAACSSSPSEDLLRDLDQTKAPEFELAPGGQGRSTVSAIEQTGTPTPVYRQPSERAEQPSPLPEPQPTVAPQQQAEAAPAPAPVFSPRPSARPSAQPGTAGGKRKTVEEVIRDAPFPVNP